MEIALYQVRTFLEVVRTGSLTKAGRNLGYSQSTVTAHIRALEAQAGTALFQRLPHGVRPTPDGETFHDYATRIFGLVNELSVSLAGGREISGRISVGASALTVDQELTRLILECRYRYPKLELCPVGMDSARISEEIGASRLDMGLVLSSADQKFPRQAGLHSEDLRTVELMAVAGRELSDSLDEGAVSVSRRPHGEAPGKTVRILRVDSGSGSPERLREAIRQRYGIESEFLPVGSVRGALELMRTGPCIAMLPREMVAREIESGEVGILRDVPGERHVVRMIWNGRSWLPPVLAATLELARRVALPVPVPA
ncbi:LysR family transcriptional regulator [Streptomyces sp. NPDC050315]|uniref:LysR family transcriptional regulator n=1 Tax=Streptomyces sp. NPDC050315 TaxID=3155039 RepID=UPI003418E180